MMIAALDPLALPWAGEVRGVVEGAIRLTDATRVLLLVIAVGASVAILMALWAWRRSRK